MQTVIKIVIILALIILPMFGLFYWLNRSATKHPIPTDPTVTLQDFFDALQGTPYQDYARCRELISPRERVGVLLNQNTIQHIDAHLDRIRNYLLKHVGTNFASTVQINHTSACSVVTFDNYIVLRCSMEPVRGLDEQNHYALKQFIDFPMDVMPVLGIEERNRAILNEGLGNPYANVDDDRNLLENKAGEMPSQRLKRLINSYQYARQLDTRHALLDAVIAEFPAAPDTRSFLYQVANNQNEALHLRQIAQNFLG